MLTLEGLENWYTQTVKLKHAFAGTTAPDPIPLPDVTNVDGMLEGIVEETENAFVAAAEYAGKRHGEDMVYKLQLPADIKRWYGLKKVGGRTMLWNQYADVGTVSWSGTRYFPFASGSRIVNGHKYFFGADITAVNDVRIALAVYEGGTRKTINFIRKTINKNIFTSEYDATADGTTSQTDGNLMLYLTGNVAWGDGDSFTNCMLIDLTLMFGSGNEPASVDEFLQMFPESYYEYNAGELKDVKVTEIVSKGADNNVLDTIDIPASVQALTGYGYSTPDKYNYIDFERKVFVQNVGAVDLGDLTFGYGPTVGWSATLSNVKDPADDDTVFNGISNNYTAVSRNTQATAFSGGTDAGMVSVAGGKVYVGTGDISIVPSGTLYYELDEPVETDISEFLTGTDIAHEAGGSITFENTNKIPVPVNVDYIGV